MNLLTIRLRPRERTPTSETSCYLTLFVNTNLVPWWNHAPHHSAKNSVVFFPEMRTSNDAWKDVLGFDIEWRNVFNFAISPRCCTSFAGRILVVTSVAYSIRVQRTAKLIYAFSLVFMRFACHELITEITWRDCSPSCSTAHISHVTLTTLA